MTAPAPRGGAGARLAATVPFAWLAVFLLAPFAIVLAVALGRSAPDSVPPVEFGAGLGNFAFLASDPLYVAAFANSVRLAAIATALALALGYPMALAIARATPRRRPILLALVILPFWTSFLVRVYAWMGLLGQNGTLNVLLKWSGLAEDPGTLLGTEWAVLLGIVYAYLPFMVLPLYAVLEKHDPALLEAAADLGCRPWRAFLSVTLPLSAPGVAAGCLLVFIPAVGEFVIPDLLGGSQTLMVGKVLWDEFFANSDWPLASAVAIALLALLLGPMALLRRARDAADRAG